MTQAMSDVVIVGGGATGGAHKGILLSAAMGKAIADLVTAGHTALSVSPGTPERFTTVSS